MLLIKMHEVRRNDVHAMRTQASAKADHRNREYLRKIFVDFLGRNLTHERETSRIYHRPGIVDQLGRAVRCLPLRKKSA